ncbi:MAG TPA: hypothetical protein DDY98_06115 [Ruminococcaceae bacterium]|nr:hypothetical protein [Oscillospiraceae bacterium]
MRTKRLFDTDGHVFSFDSVVTQCDALKNGFALALKETAFFSGGGGQRADEGTLDSEPVLEMFEKDGIIFHVVSRSYEIGCAVHGEVDRAVRFRRMQQHSGEHLLSGIAHTEYGCENVGFHMGEDYVTVDFNHPLSAEELSSLERKANEAVYKNVSIRCELPSEQELDELDYRSKLDLTENVRIVTIEGYDVCACCAPHVRRTGEIGLIKILSAMNYKGGVRLTVKSGADAWADYALKCEQTNKLIGMLCAKEEKIVETVQNQADELVRLRQELVRLERSQLLTQIETMQPTEANSVLFCGDVSADSLRFAVNEGTKKTKGIFAAFSENESGFRYCMGSASVNLSDYAKKFHAEFGGRGGGKPNMIQGSVSAEKDRLQYYIAENGG